LNIFLNGAVYELMWENMVEPTGHRWQYKAHALCMLDN
jgi:hypothetical protein